MFALCVVCSADVSGDYTYTVTDGKATITGYRGSATSVTIPSDINGIPVVAIGGKAFEGCSTITTLIVPSSVTEIGDGAFSRCVNITALVLRDGLLTIGDGAFLGCEKVSTVTIPKSVVSVGEDAFAFCSSLGAINVNANNQYYSASGSALFNKDMTTLIQFPIGKSTATSFTVPDTVTTIEEHAFYGAKYLKTVTLPDAIVNMSNDTFVNCPALTTITVGANNTKFSSVDGNLFNKAGTVLIQYAPGKTDESYTVPSGVIAIDAWAFGSCDSLKSVIIADTVDEIGYAAFANCEGLTAITIPGTATIGELAFGGCTALESVVMNEGVVSIGAAAFSGCSALADVTIPASVTTIGGVNLGTGKYIGAFGNCPAIKNFTVSASNAYFSAIDGNLFNKSATELIKYATGKEDTSYALPSSVSVIATEAFAYAASLEEILLPGALTAINDDAFRGCAALTSVNIPEGVTYIGLYAFADCAKLADVTIPSSTNFIGAYSFSGCTTLENVKIYTYTPVMGANIFRNTGNNLTIRGHVGSSVEEYASANSIGFKDAVYEPEVIVNKPTSGNVVVSAPAGGWSEGENTFTVSAETVCVVMVSYDDGKTYTRLKATAQAGGGYSFTAYNVTDGVIFKVAIAGDINNDGKFSHADVTRLKAASFGKITLNSATVCMADINNDGKFSHADVTRLKAMAFGKVQPKW